MSQSLYQQYKNVFNNAVEATINSKGIIRSAIEATKKNYLVGQLKNWSSRTLILYFPDRLLYCYFFWLILLWESKQYTHQHNRQTGGGILQSPGNSGAVYQGRQECHQVDTAVMLQALQQRNSPLASCPGLQPRQLHADFSPTFRWCQKIDWWLGLRWNNRR